MTDSAYIVSGYVVCLASLFTYGVSLLTRERRARRRVGFGAPTETDPQREPERPARP